MRPFGAPLRVAGNGPAQCNTAAMPSRFFATETAIFRVARGEPTGVSRWRGKSST